MASEMQIVNRDINTILVSTRLYAGTDDPALQQQYHQTAETARQEMAEAGFLGLAVNMGEDKTLSEKQAAASAWQTEMRALGADFGSTSGLPAGEEKTEKAPSALAGTLGAAATGASSLLAFFTGPVFLAWLPWLLAGGVAARIFRVKANLGGK